MQCAERTAQQWQIFRYKSQNLLHFSLLKIAFPDPPRPVFLYR